MASTSKGLEGVVAAETTLSKVFGEDGRLVYVGYEIEDLKRLLAAITVASSEDTATWFDLRTAFGG